VTAQALNLAVRALDQHQLEHADEAQTEFDDASQVIQCLQSSDGTNHNLRIALTCSAKAKSHALDGNLIQRCLKRPPWLSVSFA
jgi:hypothetical protein